MLKRTVIGFEVAHSVTMSSGTKIQFNTIKTNMGNAWNKHTNTFMAPVKGLYFFSLNVMTTWAPGHADAKIMHGSALLGFVHTYKTSNSGRQSATCTIVVMLNNGDQIHAERQAGTLFSDRYLYTDLVGFLIEKV